MADMMDSQTSVPHCRERRTDSLCLAIDLGTGGLRSDWSASTAASSRGSSTTSRPYFGGRRRRDPGRRVVVDHDLRVRPAPARRDGRVAAAVAAIAVTGQWASTVPSTPTGRRPARASRGSTREAASHTRRLVGGRVHGYRPTAARQVGARKAGGAPSTSGPTPSATSCSSCTNNPTSSPHALVPRAGRLPHDALHRARRQRLTPRCSVVAHRQPPPRQARVRLAAASHMLGTSTRSSCRRFARSDRSWAP